MVFTKRLHFIIFLFRGTKTNAHMNWLTNWQEKKQGCAIILHRALIGWGAGKICWKISALRHLIKIYQMRPLSARSISLDSTFNGMKGITLMCVSFGCDERLVLLTKKFPIWSATLFINSSVKECVQLIAYLPWHLLIKEVRQRVQSSLPFICLMKHEIISRFFSALEMHHDEVH